jgi:hypothetical protein
MTFMHEIDKAVHYGPVFESLLPDMSASAEHSVVVYSAPKLHRAIGKIHQGTKSELRVALLDVWDSHGTLLSQH